MSGYVASARISGPAPRLVRRASGSEDADPPPAPLAVAALEPLVESDGTDGTDALAERWSAARERWTQLTFYLFDPNAWR